MQRDTGGGAVSIEGRVDSASCCPVTSATATARRRSSRVEAKAPGAGVRLATLFSNAEVVVLDTACLRARNAFFSRDSPYSGRSGPSNAQGRRRLPFADEQFVIAVSPDLCNSARHS